MPRRLVGRYAASSKTCLADGETMVGTEYLNVGHHAVQFYGHDAELAEQVVGYLLEAFGNGGVAVVIATPGHRREFEARLRKALGGDADLAAARDSGAYLALDARETVRALMPAGRLDPAPFGRLDPFPAGQLDPAAFGRPDLAPAGRPDLAPAGRPDLAPAGRPDLAPAGRPDLAPSGRPDP